MEAERPPSTSGKPVSSPRVKEAKDDPEQNTGNLRKAIASLAKPDGSFALTVGNWCSFEHAHGSDGVSV